LSRAFPKKREGEYGDKNRKKKGFYSGGKGMILLK
jgi:hypothetical protein